MSNVQPRDLSCPYQVPAALMLAENVELVHVAGHFDEDSQTWSDREYACASAKKHCEAM